jgi:small subunit ribosomal protein S9
VVVNKRAMQEYLPGEAQRVAVLEPLNLAEATGKYDITVNVRGGGPMGQAGAIRHGISRALVMADAELRGPLKKEGFLTRDPRMKERKKYGQQGARKRFQYSKR